MKKLLIIALLFVGCAPYPQTTYSKTSTLNKTSFQKPLKKYILTIYIKDNSSIPINNAQVILQRLNSTLSREGKPDTLYSDSTGVVTKIVTPTKEKMTFDRYGELMDVGGALAGIDTKALKRLLGVYGNQSGSHLKTNVYHYYFDVFVSKDDYKSNSKKNMIHGLSDEEQEKIITINLTKPTDYFDIEFLESGNQILKEKILAFIDVLLFKTLVQSANINFFSIKLNSFKDNTYLTIGFEHLVIFNSLKMNKYDIGKYIYDEVIRKILSPLNEYIYSPDDYWGYDLTVEGKTESFLDKSLIDENSTTIKYRFLIPAETVKSYKNLDITGQDVLDASYILMDGERIKLQLQ
jgi:hypothetical protein